jgi:hypothetical protein
MRGGRWATAASWRPLTGRRFQMMLLRRLKGYPGHPRTRR